MNYPLQLQITVYRLVPTTDSSLAREVFFFSFFPFFFFSSLFGFASEFLLVFQIMSPVSILNFA